MPRPKTKPTQARERLAAPEPPASWRCVHGQPSDLVAGAFLVISAIESLEAAIAAGHADLTRRTGHVVVEAIELYAQLRHDAGDAHAESTDPLTLGGFLYRITDSGDIVRRRLRGTACDLDALADGESEDFPPEPG